MANTRVTTAAENPLCSRLKTRFDGRGMDSTRVQTGTFNAVRNETKAQKRAAAVANPFEETATFVRSEATVKATAAAQTVRFTKAGAVNEAAARRRADAYERSTPFASGAYSAAYQRAAAIRARAADGSEARESARRQAERNAKKKGPIPFTPSWFKGILLGNEDEVVVKKAPVSASLIIGIILFAAVVLMIIFSFAQISEFKKEISTLEDRKAELVCEIDELSLAIDLENDIRVIEQIATEDIGMVKSNRVESKYITIAEGERIELPESTSDEDVNYGIFSTMMSTVSSNWDRLMEYID